ncbi:MAG: hypothetical protein HDQ88_08880 [Clostridia bacterium]|nr:hypothetical protein [Clostridia bacterium]
MNAIWDKIEMFDGRKAMRTNIQAYRMILHRTSTDSFELTIKRTINGNEVVVHTSTIFEKKAWDAQDRAYEILKLRLVAERDILMKATRDLEQVMAERNV